MGIVRYFNQGLRKMYDVHRALADSGWGITIFQLDNLKGMRLVDRSDPDHCVTVNRVSRFLDMYLVHYEEGGWQCLDNAIDQFARLEE